MGTGKGLKFGLFCDSIHKHNWMSFVSWYSFSKNIPDADFFVFVKRGFSKKQYFGWANRCKVPLKYISDNYEFDGISISPTIMAVRHYDEENLGPSSSKSQNLTTLVDYFDGVGSFNESKWINNVSPFNNAEKRFYQEGMTANEIAVLNIWEQCEILFSMV